MKVLLRVLLISAAILSAAFAQTVGASLQGTVSDPSGAVISNATVEIVNIDTSAVRSLVTDEGGRWREPVLPPGEYQIRVSAPGFQTLLRKGIHLAVGQDAVIDLRLELGSTQTEISVAAEAPAINLVSGAVSGLVDEKQMRDLPLNGRSFQQLALLQTGVNAVTASGNDPVGGRTPNRAASCSTGRTSTMSTIRPPARLAACFWESRRSWSSRSSRTPIHRSSGDRQAASLMP